MPLWWVGFTLGILFASTLLFTLNLGFSIALAFDMFDPTTLDSSVWYWDVGLVGPCCILAVALYGVWISLAGKPVFREELS